MEVRGEVRQGSPSCRSQLGSMASFLVRPEKEAGVSSESLTSTAGQLLSHLTNQ